MTAHQPLRVTAYLRGSTQKQGEDGLGVEAQRLAIARQISAMPGAILVSEHVEVESGRRRTRPALQRALAEARSGGGNSVLMVARADRLARSAAFLLAVRDGLGKAQLICADLPLLSGPAARLTLTVLAGAAEFESDMVSERTRLAMAAAKARGATFGANGRVLAAHNKALAAERLAPVAPRLRALQAEGLSIGRIADVLNAEGHKSPGGGRWHRSSTHRALRRLHTMT